MAVLVPAYNEEKVIERTVRAVLASNYPNFRVIVIDDGSSDKTLEVARRAFALPKRLQGGFSFLRNQIQVKPRLLTSDCFMSKTRFLSESTPIL